MSEENQQMEIPIERIVVIPDLYEGCEKLLDAQGSFGQFFYKYGFGPNNVGHMMRAVDRPDVEPYPNTRGERVRQLIANIMVFVLPDELYARIRSIRGDEGEDDFSLIGEVIADAVLFASVKTKASGEMRLHGKLACGFGGHVDEADWQKVKQWGVDPRDLIDVLIGQAAFREIHEELTYTEEGGGGAAQTFDALARGAVVPFGVINSNAGLVERVHIGMINVLAVPRSLGIRINESDKLTPVTIPLRELRGMEAQSQYELDAWTTILFRNNSSLFASNIIKSVKASYWEGN